MSLFLLHLPQVIAIEVLCKWCELKDVMQVDSAFCNKTERPELLKMFQALEFTTSHEVSNRFVFYYLIERGIKVLGIGNQLEESCLNGITIEMFSNGQIFSKLQSLSIPATAEWYQFTNMCMLYVSLVSLSVTPPNYITGNTQAGEFEESFLLQPINLTQLTNLDCSDMTVSAEFVSHLSQSCHSLATFAVCAISGRFKKSYLNNTDVCEIIRNNTGLTKLMICGYYGVTPAVAQLISQHCGNLVELDLDFAQESDLNFTTIVNPILSACTLLKQLDLASRAFSIHVNIDHGPFGNHMSIYSSSGPAQEHSASVEELETCFSCLKNIVEIEICSMVNMNWTVFDIIKARNPDLARFTIGNYAVLLETTAQSASDS